MISGKILKTLFVFAAGAALIASCDSEYNNIGADIIAGDIHHNGMTRYEGNVIAYDQATGHVQSNNTPLNVLGIYDNPTFGKTTAHFVTQLELSAENPKISANATIDSVYMHVPYYSTYQSTDATGLNIYKLDSIHGNKDAEMTLRVYRNGYFLRSSDPGSPITEVQKYYSDERPAIDGAKMELLAEFNNFKFSNAEILRKYGTDKIAERFTPGIYTLLDNAYFKNAIIDKRDSGELANNNIFKNYFRGLYFNITQNGGPGAMAAARFAEGKIVIIYHDHPQSTDGNGFNTTVDKVRKTIVLNMKGNTINFFDNDYEPDYLNTLTPANTDVAQGDSRLYIKGGQGSIGVVKILDDEDIATLTAEKVLINEANLIFYVDQTTMGSSPNPLRLYLYDLKNKRPLFDYYADATTNNSNQKFDKLILGGVGTKGTLNNQSVIRYKIRLTNHVNNIINKDSTNVPIGLVLTENINIISNAALRTPFTAAGIDVKTLPLTSVISPLGTVLYGNTGTDVPEDQKLRLEIFYTKPN